MTNGGFATPPMVAPASTPPSPAAQPEPGAEAPRQEGPGERITAWQAEIERYHAAITAPVSDCRDICGAAGGICQASREICRLTGDAAEARAHDPRCQRSREACTDASRRRDAACAVCPPLR